MLFKLTSTGTYYPDAETRVKYEALGFKFNSMHYKIKDDNLTISFNTIEELFKFTEEVYRVVVDSDSIEIYDDYRE
jgi:hypothetical protein